MSRFASRFLIVGFLPLLWGADETFVLLDGRTGQKTVENEARAKERFTPCSTFKIPNSMIALDSGVASDPKFELEYDPKRDGPQNGIWATNQTLESAVRYSAAWYFQEMARRVGPARMQQYLERFDYGNRNMSGGVDRFWIGHGLAISAEEQIAFLQRLNEGRLGVPLRTAATVRDLILLETTPQYRWYGKTGTCYTPERQAVAWHVGFVEREGKLSYYALNFSGTSVSEVFARRRKLIREKLARAALIVLDAPPPRQQMDARIRAAIAAFPGTVGLFARNLDTGEEFGIRPDNQVRTASTIKLPIMTAVFAAVAEGKAKWEETLLLREEDKISGSGVIRELTAGIRLPLRDLVHLMIVVSDNTATNLVLDRIGADRVNAEMNKLGMGKTRSLRKVLGDGGSLKPVASGHSREGRMPEFQRFGLGVSTPREMVQLLAKLERGEVVNAEASAEMLSILRRQQYKDGIGRQLPDAAVESKSGSLDRLRSDVGVVHSNGGRIALAFTVDDMLRTDYSADNAGSVLISQLTGMVLEGLSAPVEDLSGPEKVVDLKGPIGHVQGIAVDGERVLVSWVDQQKKTGHLGEFEIVTGRLIRSVPVQRDTQYHPGGIAVDGDSVWIAVSEYRPKSSATIQRRNRKTLALEAEFRVTDHIGCVAVADGKVYGGNWDSRQIYTWDRAGKLESKRDNTAGTRYQDLKLDGGRLVGAGPRGTGGAIDWLDPGDLRLIRRIRAGKSSRGVVLTQEGMAVAGGKLYLLPEDSPSRLFIFPLPW